MDDLRNLGLVGREQVNTTEDAARFYCFYCDANSPDLTCKRCSHTARPCQPVRDAYFLRAIQETQPHD